jgi:hypothetical protein
VSATARVPILFSVDRLPVVRLPVILRAFFRLVSFVLLSVENENDHFNRALTKPTGNRLTGNCQIPFNSEGKKIRKQSEHSHPSTSVYPGLIRPAFSPSARQIKCPAKYLFSILKKIERNFWLKVKKSIMFDRPNQTRPN